MKKILVPTEFTYLSKCALNLGVQLSKAANSSMSVVSVIEPNYNSFMEEGEQYSHDPTSSLKNISITEKARERMHERAEEISQMLPESSSVAPKIIYGKKVEALVKEIEESKPDLVIIGGDLYEQEEKFATDFLKSSPAPVVILKCMISGLDRFKDIVLLADIENDSSQLISRVKDLQELLQAKIHVLRVNTPRNFLAPKKCTATLEQYASMHSLEDITLISLDATTEMSGLFSYAETIDNAFLCLGIHERGLLEKLMVKETNPDEVIINSMHPVWTYKD